MNPGNLQRLFDLNHQALHLNVEGLTDEEALVQPRPAGNCLNWVVGHIVASRNGVLEAMGQEPIWPPEQAAPYKRHSAPIARPGQGMPFHRILADLDRSQERIQSWLAASTEVDLTKPHGDKDTIGGWLAFLHFHEAYHVGQTGVLRRIAGREGAIR